MELLQLRYFCDAAMTENFSKTAYKFSVPPSSISQIVKRLEQELNVELFEHRKNRVRLTEAGRVFYEHTATALQLLEKAKTAVASVGPIQGDIKLMVLTNRRIVTAAIERFKSIYPNVRFIICHKPTSDAEYDILISDKCFPGFSEYQKLINEDILLAVNRDSSLARKETILPIDLQAEEFISMPYGQSLYDNTLEICKQAGFCPNITIQTDDPFYVRKYVEMGLGIAFVPSYSWQGMFSDKTVLKKVGDYKRNTSIYLSSVSGIKPSISSFIRCLDETIRHTFEMS